VAWTDRFFLPAALLLLAVLATVQIGSIRQESQTWDESTHLAAGLSYWKTGDYRMNPEHPPLAKLLCSLPLLFMDVRLPFEFPSWAQTDEMNFGAQFLYTNRLSADQILFPARLVTIALTLLLAASITWWTRRHFGSASALLALALFAFDPNIIAHGRYVTTDLIVALFAFLTCALWGERYFVAAGAALGLAAVSKFTGLFLLPVLVILALIRRPGWKQLLFALLAAFAVLELVYIPDLLRYHHLIPVAYVKGLRTVLEQYREGRVAYLLGEISTKGGWWYYFPVVYLVKAPSALIAFVALCVALVVRKRPRITFEILTVAVPALIYWLFCLRSHMDMGIRHLLPAYILMLPLLAIVAVRYAPKWLTIALVALLAVESLSIYPDYLAFFNWPSGGPGNGPRYLLDSNIDWGQDTKKLAAWLKARGQHEICGIYFGLAVPAHYGIEGHELPGNDDTQERANLDCIAAASVTPLYGLYIENDKYRWLREMTPTAKIGYSIYVYDLRRKR
jgi:hypothetical protein